MDRAGVDAVAPVQLLASCCKSCLFSVSCLLLLVQLNNAYQLRWWYVFSPFVCGQCTSVCAHAWAFSRSKDCNEPNPSLRLVWHRNKYEALYKLAHSISVLISCTLLMTKVDQISAVFSAEQCAEHIAFTAFAVPIWIAWVVQTALWLSYRRLRNGAVEAGLTDSHRQIKIRGHDQTFFNNLLVTLIARQLDGAYMGYINWSELLTVVWVQLGLLGGLYVLCIPACAGALLLSYLPQYQHRLAPYRNMLWRLLVLVSCGIWTVRAIAPTHHGGLSAGPA